MATVPKHYKKTTSKPDDNTESKAPEEAFERVTDWVPYAISALSYFGNKKQVALRRQFGPEMDYCQLNARRSDGKGGGHTDVDMEPGDLVWDPDKVAAALAYSRKTAERRLAAMREAGVIVDYGIAMTRRQLGKKSVPVGSLIHYVLWYDPDIAFKRVPSPETDAEKATAVEKLPLKAKKVERADEARLEVNHQGVQLYDVWVREVRAKLNRPKWVIQQQGKMIGEFRYMLKEYSVSDLEKMIHEYLYHGNNALKGSMAQFRATADMWANLVQGNISKHELENLIGKGASRPGQSKIVEQEGGITSYKDKDWDLLGESQAGHERPSVIRVEESPPPEDLEEVKRRTREEADAEKARREAQQRPSEEALSLAKVVTEILSNESTRNDPQAWEAALTANARQLRSLVKDHTLESCVEYVRAALNDMGVRSRCKSAVELNKAFAKRLGVTDEILGLLVQKGEAVGTAA